MSRRIRHRLSNQPIERTRAVHRNPSTRMLSKSEAASAGSYSDEYRRQRMAKKLLGDDANGRSNILTDRAAYMTYLEVQLDRVSASCMAVQAFSDRIQQIQDQATLNEARLQTVMNGLQQAQARFVWDGFSTARSFSLWDVYNAFYELAFGSDFRPRAFSVNMLCNARIL